MARCPDPLGPSAAGPSTVLAVVEALAIVAAAMILGAILALGAL